MGVCCTLRTLLCSIGELLFSSGAVCPSLHLQVLIGCDGINSVVAKWLGLAEPTHSGRMAARGLARFPDGHGFEPEFLQFNGRGLRSGMRPCNDTDI